MPTPAGFFARLAAFLIDILLVGTVLLVVRLPMWVVQLASPDNWFVRDVLFRFSLYDIFLYLAAAAYFIIMTYVAGATVGKRLMNLQVVSNTDEPLTLFNIIYRETIGRYLSSLLFLGYLMIGVTEAKRGLHDILADTQVVYTCKILPAASLKPTTAYASAGAAYDAPVATPAPRDFGSIEPSNHTGSTSSVLQTPPPITYRPFGGARTNPSISEPEPPTAPKEDDRP